VHFAGDVAVLENLDAILSVPGIDLYSIGIPASPTIRKLSRQWRKSQIASGGLGARCNWT
jgi:hypothetical protein